MSTLQQSIEDPAKFEQLYRLAIELFGTRVARGITSCICHCCSNTHHTHYITIHEVKE